METAEQKAIKNASRGISRDMSPEAISRRFEKLRQLNELCRAVEKGKWVDPAPATDDAKS